jgi:quercetin dioxygenase-like cupin family protein
MGRAGFEPTTSGLEVRPERRRHGVANGNVPQRPRFAGGASCNELILAETNAPSLVLGQVKEMHVHDPPQDHVITVRSGQMRWTVDGETLDAGPGDVIVTPAGTPHSYEVLGDEPARVVCVDSPVRPMSD